MKKPNHYLGFDLSTQTLKATIIDDNSEIICEASVDPEIDLPHYGTCRSHYINGDEVRTPILMWIEAIELVLNRLKQKFPDFSLIKALSGGTQQCGSVYWRNEDALKRLDVRSSLVDQLRGSFTIKNVQNWLDSSSRDFCEKLIRKFGADAILHEVGYVPTLGLAGPRVAKVIETQPEIFEATCRITMMSSFACSLFLGKLAPTDYQDGITMMFFDFRNKSWSKWICDGIHPNLRRKLGPIVPSATVLGHIDPYFVKKYGFSDACQVVAWTGDNAGSIVGSGICDDDVFLTLGTGDCLEFLSHDLPKLSKKGGFLFNNPLDDSRFARAIGWKNASLARDRIRRESGYKSWQEFDDAITSLPPGNNGNLGIFLFEPDVMPISAQGVVRVNGQGERVETFNNFPTECRAIIESQMLQRRYDSEQLGLKLSPQTRLLLTGGPSKSMAICQIAADVFGVPIFGMETVNSCSFGGALRAKYALAGRDTVDELISKRKWIPLCQPNKETQKIYQKLMKRYIQLAEPLVPPYFPNDFIS